MAGFSLGEWQGHAHVVRRICLDIEGYVFLGGILFGLPGSRLSLPRYIRVELTLFI